MALPVNWCGGLIRKPSKHSLSRSLQVVDRMNASAVNGILLRLWRRTVSLLSIAGWSVANRRGLKLLKANLTSTQLNDFLTYRCFDVVGGVSGRVYRIRY